MHDLHGKLPEGMYHVDVVAVDRWQGQTGPLWRVTLQLHGTDGVLYDFLSPRAAWKWNTFKPTFAELPLMLGDEFLVWVRLEQYEHRMRNHVREYAVQVL